MTMSKMHKVIVPIDQAGAKKFADIIAASKSQPIYQHSPDVGVMRQGYDAFGDSDLARRVAPDTAVEETQVGGTHAYRLRPKGALNKGTLIHLHGGAFVVGSARGELAIADSFARALCMETVGVDYAEAPEHPFPAGIDNVFKVVRAIQDEKPGAPVFIAGDSAGGSLAVSAALRLRDEGPRQITGIISVSALVNWRLDSQSWADFGDRDLVPRSRAVSFRDMYLGGIDPSDPVASPVLADVTGLPPMILMAGGAETLLDDSLTLGQNATAAGCDVEVHVFEGAPHNFIKFAHPSADLAFEHAAEWARSRGFIAR